MPKSFCSPIRVGATAEEALGPTTAEHHSIVVEAVRVEAGYERKPTHFFFLFRTSSVPSHEKKRKENSIILVS